MTDLIINEKDCIPVYSYYTKYSSKKVGKKTVWDHEWDKNTQRYNRVQREIDDIRRTKVEDVTRYVYGDRDYYPHRVEMRVGSSNFSYYWVLDKENEYIYGYKVNMNIPSRATTKAEWKHSYGAIRIDKYKNIQCMASTTERWYPVQRFSFYGTPKCCQKGEVIRQIFGSLFGNELNYKNMSLDNEDLEQQNWKFLDFLNTKIFVPSNKTKAKIDKIIGEVGNERKEYTWNKFNNPYRWSNGVVVFDYNTYPLIRVYEHEQEISRYIFTDKKIEYMRYVNGSWQKARIIKLNSYYRNKGTIITKELMGSPKYKYIKQYIDEYTSNNNNPYNNCIDTHEYNEDKYIDPYKTNFVYRILSNDLLEQLLKIYPTIEQRQQIYSHNGDIEQIYGKLNKKGKTLYSKLGVNKVQYENPKYIILVKKLLKTENISNMDNQTWTDFTNIPASFFEDYRIRYIYNGLINLDVKNIPQTIIKILNLIKTDKQESRYGGMNYNLMQPYYDYLNNLSQLQNMNEDIHNFPITINSASELITMHDRSSQLISAIKNTADDERIAKMQPKYEKYAFEDDNYIITWPKKSADLTREGSIQSICIGGYVRNFSMGQTQLFFLRKKQNPEIPFYAIEVRNGNVAQIHGKYNQWLSATEDGYKAIPMLVEWMHKNKITCDKRMLLCKATGYGAISDYAEMPKIADEIYNKVII